MEDHIDYSNLIFHRKLGEGGGGTVNHVTFRKPFKGYTEGAAKSVWEVPEPEVEVMKRLQHPNIVPLLGFYQAGPINLILLEYASQGSLHDYLKDHSKPVSQQLTWKWLVEAADALEYLHDRSILHRDIKAPNCLLFEDNVLKLSDFGLAREIDHLQTTSEQKGTYRYMAPEIHRGNDQGRGIYSKASDIYAYGMLTLEIVTRKPPFAGGEWQTVVFKVREGERPEIPSECPLPTAHIIQSCWCDDPKQRPSIRKIKQILKPDMTITEHHGDPKVKTITLNGSTIERIFCSPDGNMVIWDSTNECLRMFGESGEHKCNIPLRHGHTVQDIGVLPQGYTVVLTGTLKLNGSHDDEGISLSTTKDVHILNLEGKNVHSFSVAKEYLSWKCTMTTDREGQILVALPNFSDQGLIRIFDNPHLDPKVQKNVMCEKTIKRMTVNSREQILYIYISRKSSSRLTDNVQAIDNSGKKLFKFTPTVAGGRVHSIHSIACDSQDNIYIVIWAISYNEDSSHVHQYSSTGSFVRCVHTETGCVFDLSISPSNGTLLLAKNDNVRITCPISANLFECAYEL